MSRALGSTSDRFGLGLFAVLALAISHGLSFWLNFLVRGEYLHTSAAAQMFRPTAASSILHMTIIFGALAISFTGAPAAAIAVLVVLKTGSTSGCTSASIAAVAVPPAVETRLAAPTAASAARVRRVVQDGLGLGGSPCRQTLRERRIPEGEDLGREQAGVRGVADGDGRDRDAARHLDDREQRVQAAEVLRRDRHADDRQERLGGEHPGQVRGTAGAGDDDPDARGRGLLGVAEQVVGRPMRGHDPQLGGDAELGEDRDGRPRGSGSPSGCRRRRRRRGVGVATVASRPPPSSGAIARPARRVAAARARASASSTSRRCAVTWPILRRSKTRRLS